MAPIWCSGLGFLEDLSFFDFLRLPKPSRAEPSRKARRDDVDQTELEIKKRSEIGDKVVANSETNSNQSESKFGIQGRRSKTESKVGRKEAEFRKLKAKGKESIQRKNKRERDPMEEERKNKKKEENSNNQYA